MNKHLRNHLMFLAWIHFNTFKYKRDIYFNFVC